MPALEQKRLLEACRALGEAVAGQPVLPPLIREAGEGQGSGGVVHYAATGDAWVRFEARFDRAYVNRHEFPLKRLPLLFDCALCDGERRPQASLFDEDEKFALLCAFFLSAQTQIGVEPIEDKGEYRLSLRLSPTFVVEWREAFQPDALESCETLCRRVASSLWDKSREFFASERLGTAVWSLRAAQELLGAPKLSPKAVEDFIAASLAEGRAPRAETFAPPPPKTRAEALALMISPHSEPAAIEVAALPASPAPLVAGERAVPALVADRRVAFGGKAWRRIAGGLVAALVPLALILSVGSFISVSHNSEAEPTRVEASDARIVVAPPAPVAALGVTAVSTGAEATASIEPPIANDPPVAIEQKPIEDAMAAKATPAPKPSGKRTARRSRRERDPFAAVGRAVNRFTTGVWDGLSSIPKHFGGYSYN